MLEVLRESGALEQDADAVLHLSRDLDPSSPRRSVLEVLVAKNRNGRVGSVDFA